MFGTSKIQHTLNRLLRCARKDACFVFGSGLERQANEKWARYIAQLMPLLGRYPRVGTDLSFEVLS